LPHDLLFRLVDVLEKRDNHGNAKAADEDIEDAGNVAES